MGRVLFFQIVERRRNIMFEDKITIFESGDIVLYSTGGGLKSNIGLILKHKDNGEYAILSVYSSAYKNIKAEWISPIDKVEDVRDEITGHYESKIQEKQLLIRKPTREEKDREKVEKYEELKREIMVVAKRLSESTDDTDFENRLKAIADMKKNIFSIELDCVSEIRKNNGRVKYDIHQLIQQKESELNKISDESIEKAFVFK